MYDINTHKDITNYKNVYHCQYNYSLQLIVPPTIDKTDNSQLRVMLTNGKGEFIDYYNYVIDSTVNSEGGIILVSLSTDLCLILPHCQI